MTNFRLVISSFLTIMTGHVPSDTSKYVQLFVCRRESVAISGRDSVGGKIDPAHASVA
jgi:hypothetical protein